MDPLITLLGKALVDFAIRNTDEPEEQDAVLDFLENFVENTGTQFDDKYFLPAFKAIRVVLDIQELPGSEFADEVLEELDKAEQTIRPLVGPKEIK